MSEEVNQPPAKKARLENHCNSHTQNKAQNQVRNVCFIGSASGGWCVNIMFVAMWDSESSLHAPVTIPTRHIYGKIGRGFFAVCCACIGTGVALSNRMVISGNSLNSAILNRVS